jgi:hypothetical protein
VSGIFPAARTDLDRFASPLSKRGEDEGEGFKRTRRWSILTLPLSFGKGEATRNTRNDTKVAEQ